MRIANLKIILAAAAMMLLAAPGAAPPARAAAPQPMRGGAGPAVGQTAPEIQGKTPDGKPISLSDFKGKLVMLDFFGDW